MEALISASRSQRRCATPPLADTTDGVACRAYSDRCYRSSTVVSDQNRSLGEALSASEVAPSLGRIAVVSVRERGTEAITGLLTAAEIEIPIYALAEVRVIKVDINLSRRERKRITYTSMYSLGLQ